MDTRTTAHGVVLSAINALAAAPSSCSTPPGPVAPAPSQTSTCAGPSATGTSSMDPGLDAYPGDRPVLVGAPPAKCVRVWPPMTPVPLTTVSMTPGPASTVPAPFSRVPLTTVPMTPTDLPESPRSLTFVEIRTRADQWIEELLERIEELIDLMPPDSDPTVAPTALTALAQGLPPALCSCTPCSDAWPSAAHFAWRRELHDPSSFAWYVRRASFLRGIILRLAFL